MLTALLATALLAPPPPDLPAPAPPMTVSQLYDGCARYVASASTPSDRQDVGEATCAVTAATMLVVDAAEAALHEMDRSRPDARKFCLPESVSRAEGDAGVSLARAFIAYVERNAASREASADEVFQHAMADKWPCPR